MRYLLSICCWIIPPVLAAVLALSPTHVCGGSLVAAGPDHSVVVDEPHGITQVGRTGSNNFPIPAGLTSGASWLAIAAGDDHGLAIDGSGALFSWGGNGSGQLGRLPVAGEPAVARVGNEEDWKFVVAGKSRSAAIKTDGSLWTWGTGVSGIDGIVRSEMPLRVGNENTWKTVAMGLFHSLALREDGSLWAWGSNSHYSLGDGTNLSRSTPVRIGNDNDWVALACGRYTSFAIKTDGSLWVWGGATHSRVYGIMPAVQAPLAIPTHTGTGNDWKSIHPATDGEFVLALKQNETLWSWGDNPQGVLGHGDTTARDIPTQVGTLSGWRCVAAGETHAIATRVDGSVWHWGALPSNDLPASMTPADLSAQFAPVAGMQVFGNNGDELTHPEGLLTCSTVILAEPKPNLLRLRNDGLLPLIISEIIPPEGFGVSAVPAVVPPLQEATLSVHLTALNKGAFSGGLLIRSNRHGIPEFNVELAGQVVSADDDTDNDGLNDAAEVAMAPLGFDWDYPQQSMTEALITHRDIAGLSQEGDVRDVRIKAHPPRLTDSGPTIELELQDIAQDTSVALPQDALQLRSSTEAEILIPVAPDRRRVRINGGQ